MPASPHLERFTLDDDGQQVDVVAIALDDFDGTELALLVPTDAFDDPSPDMDAWVRSVRTDARGERVLGEVPDDLIDPAWERFEAVLSLTFATDAP